MPSEPRRDDKKRIAKEIKRLTDKGLGDLQNGFLSSITTDPDYLQLRNTLSGNDLFKFDQFIHNLDTESKQEIRNVFQQDYLRSRFDDLCDKYSL